MSDDKLKRGNPDRSRINTSEEYEIRYWTHKFGVSSQQLNEAIKKAGNAPDAVRKVLGK
jgi:hypothetical protein